MYSLRCSLVLVIAICMFLPLSQAEDNVYRVEGLPEDLHYETGKTYQIDLIVNDDSEISTVSISITNGSLSETEEFSEIIQILELGNISFARDLYLKNILGVNPGSVTPFGLINDQESRIKFFLDKKILYHKKVNFHPLVNTSTISLDTKEFLLFMKKNNKLVNIFNFDNYILENG